MVSNAIRLFNLGGFEIKLDPSWFLIALLVPWTPSTQYLPITLPSLTGTAYITMPCVAILGFLDSL